MPITRITRNDKEYYLNSWQHWETHGSCPSCNNTRINIKYVDGYGLNYNPHIERFRYWKYSCKKCKDVWFAITEKQNIELVK